MAASRVGRVLLAYKVAPGPCPPARSATKSSCRAVASSAPLSARSSSSRVPPYAYGGLAAAAGVLLGFWISTSRSGTRQREARHADFVACIAQLQSVLPKDCISSDIEDLRSHGVGQWSESPARALPGCVVYPRSTADVVQIVNVARAHGIPLIPYGAGTTIEGSINAPCCGVSRPPPPGQVVDTSLLQPGFSISVDMAAHMHELVQVHEDDLQITVQPGMAYETLNATLQGLGIPLFFPCDPGPGATIGGMVATGASGTNAVRYGTMREGVLSLQVVLPSGEVIRTRSRAAKSSAGPDLTKLFVGSEGTLGIIVEATLKLVPILEFSVAKLVCPTVKDAAAIVADMLKQGITVQCCELLDENLVRAVNEASRRKRDGMQPLLESPTLLIKLQGDEVQRAATSKRLAQIAYLHGCRKIENARNAAESDLLWRARKVALNSALEMAPGMPYHSTDVCVPISRFPILANEFKEGLTRLSFPFAGLVGHAGDGNLHSIILYETPEQDRAACDLADRMARRAIELEGTCAGEHGIGTGKKHLLRGELGGSIELMRSIKRLVDPRNIMNPAVLYPEDDVQGRWEM